jgi:hypothetical protein
MDIPFSLPAVLKEEATPESGDAPVRLSSFSVISSGAAGSSDTEASVCGAVFGPSGIPYESSDEFDFDAVYSYYREKICDLNESKVRFLLLNRQTTLADMRAALLAARDKDLPLAACLTADRRSRSCSFLSSLITLQAMGISTLGLCGVPDDAMLESFRRASAHTTVPLTVIADAEPNQSPEEYAEAVRPLLEAGVRLLGCGRGTTPEHCRALGELAKKFGPPDFSEEPDCLAAASDRETFFLGDDIQLSEPLPCSASLVDKLIDLDDEQVTAALVYVESVSDAELLGKCASMSRLPIAVRADSPVVLNATLRYVQGRLIVDSGSSVEREVLEPMAAKYGAIVY